MADDASSSDAAVRALTQKLRHPILDIRERALAALAFKLDNGLLAPADVGRHLPLLRALLEWFNHEDKGSKEADVLAMLRRLAEEDPAASRRLMDLGAADFMRDLSGCVRRRPPRRPPSRPPIGTSERTLRRCAAAPSVPAFKSRLAASPSRRLPSSPLTNPLPSHRPLALALQRCHTPRPLDRFPHRVLGVPRRRRDGAAADRGGGGVPVEGGGVDERRLEGFVVRRRRGSSLRVRGSPRGDRFRAREVREPHDPPRTLRVRARARRVPGLEGGGGGRRRRRARVGSSGRAPGGDAATEPAPRGDVLAPPAPTRRPRPRRERG